MVWKREKQCIRKLSHDTKNIKNYWLTVSKDFKLEACFWCIIKSNLVTFWINFSTFNGFFRKKVALLEARKMAGKKRRKDDSGVHYQAEHSADKSQSDRKKSIFAIINLYYGKQKLSKTYFSYWISSTLSREPVRHRKKSLSQNL